MQSNQIRFSGKQISSWIKFAIFIIILGFNQTTSLQAQVTTTGCLSYDFGVDCGLYSNIIEYGTGSPAAGSRDWFFSAGSGKGVIDETNPSSVQSILQAPGNPLYVRRMNVPISYVDNGKLMIDAVFARDHFGGTGAVDQTSYTTASKNGEAPSSWATGASNVLGKNDIIDVAGHMFREGPNLTDHLWFTGMINRAEPGGDAYMDFEFFINKVSYTPGVGLSSAGNEEGHTAYKFNATPEIDGTYKIKSIGDFIFNVNLTGGGTNPSVEVRLWVSRADWMANKHPSEFNWGTEFDGATNGSSYGYANIIPTSTEEIVCAYVNKTGENPLAPPWGTKNTKNNIWGTSYTDYSVVELGLNLTHLGIDHSTLQGGDPCDFPIHTFMAKTRSSGAFTAALKDFTGPYKWAHAEIEGLVIGNTMLNCDNATAMITLSPVRDDATYSWTTVDGEIYGSTTNDTIIVTKPGTYTVHTTLNNSCTIPDTSVLVTYDPAHIPFSSLTYNSSSACFGQSNGSISMNITGAPGPYLWNWSDGSGSGSGSGTTISNLSPGTYSVTVTSQNGTGCSKYFSIVVNQNPEISIAASPQAATCFGTASGSINITVSGGTPGYTYLWNGGATTQNLSGISAGTYNVTVTDSKGCIKATSVVVGQASEITASSLITNVTCNGQNNGSIDLTTSGGTGTLTYIWNDGSSFEDRNGLIAGTYSVTITDGNSCTKIISPLTVTQPSSLSASAILSPILCNGGNSTITVTPSGGTGPFQYSLNGGVYGGSNTFVVSASGNPYIITVKDANGCLTTTTTTVSQPNLMTLSLTPSPATCQSDFDGEILLDVLGGTPNFLYVWSGPNGFSSTSEDISGLEPGTYTVFVTDANGCSANTTVVLGYTNPNPVQPGTINN